MGKMLINVYKVNKNAGFVRDMRNARGQCDGTARTVYMKYSRDGNDRHILRERLANGWVSSRCFMRATFYLPRDNRSSSPTFLFLFIIFFPLLSFSPHPPFLLLFFLMIESYETGSFFRAFDDFSTCHATPRPGGMPFCIRSCLISHDWSPREPAGNFVPPRTSPAIF